jgi:N-carbamoyl-L-amino-acid hydrolase
MGSSAAAGLLSSDLLGRKDDEGVTLAERLRQYGQDPARISEARLSAGSIAAYIELHVEQGGILEQATTQIGVVQGIVGIHGWECTVEGFANHAGTTPMNGRRDALLTASRAVVAVREQVLSEAGRQVGTVGFLRAEPGARNIIPGRVIFQLELRDLDNDKVARIWSRISDRFAIISREENVGVVCKSQQSDKSALTDPVIKTAIREAARIAGYSAMDLPSGAGHDAQQIARLAPMGMIFVPSRGGISHSPREYSSPEDVSRGAEVLYRTLLTLDADLQGSK